MVKATAKKLSSKGSTPIYNYRNVIIENVAGRTKVPSVKWTYFLDGQRRYTTTLEGCKFDIDMSLDG